MENIFFWTAVISTVLFVVKLIGTLTVGDIDLGMEDAESDESFFAFSLQSFLAFTMLFGWTGLAAVTEYYESDLFGLGVGIGAGFVGVWLNGLIFRSFRYFNTPSITPEPSPVVGTRGVVYTKIGPNGGQIYTSVRANRRYYTARSASGEIDSFKIVEIVAVDGDLLTVKEI